MRRAVLDAILADDVGSIADLKSAVANGPTPQRPTAFVDTDNLDHVTDHAGKLMGLTGLALDRAVNILEKFPDRNSPSFGDELRATTSTIKTVLATQLRVDENQLRRRTIDALPQLLKEVAAEERRLAARGAIDAIQRKVA